jgi:hypothetical protein
MLQRLNADRRPEVEEGMGRGSSIQADELFAELKAVTRSHIPASNFV